jgi:hypothetical protein
VRLWSLTKMGGQAVADLSEAEATVTLLGGVMRAGHRRRQADTTLMAAYRAVAAISALFASRPTIRAWQQPWIRFYQSAPDQLLRVRLPAGVVLESPTAGLQPILLLPDVGTRPVASFRTTLRRLDELERWLDVDPPDLAVVLIDAADTEARAAAWNLLIERHVASGHARVLSEAEPHRGVRGGYTATALTRPRNVSGAIQADTMLDLLARHPLLISDQLAALLDTTHRRVSALQTSLVRRGFLREVTLDASIVDPTTAARLRLFELTLAGTRQSLRRLGLSSTEAARHHGYLAHSSRMRRRMLRHLAHTVGASQFFVDLALAARHVTRSGGDDSLLEWRSAAACGRGRCRPDGFGCYRRGDARFGFFLEYDRATERPREYAAKLDAYYRFRDTGWATREFESFPTLLVVSTSSAAEDLIAYQAYLAAERHGGSPLPLLLSTTELFRATPLQMLGAVWRSPSRATGTGAFRGDWLPALPHRVARICHERVERVTLSPSSSFGHGNE